MTLEALKARWRELASNGLPGVEYCHRPSDQLLRDADELDAAHRDLYAAVEALPKVHSHGCYKWRNHIDRDAVLRLIGEPSK